MSQNPDMTIIGIAGPSGAGKTTLANYLVTYFGDDFEHIRQDDYLKNLDEFPKKGEFINWEHPKNYKFELIYEHLKKLQNGEEVLSRSFVWRQGEVAHEFYLRPKNIVLVEGSLILTSEDLTSMFDKKIYLDIPTEVMLRRRAQRMGEHYNHQYDLQVTVPEFERHGMVQKIFADHIIDATKSKKEVSEEVKKIIKG